MVRKRGIYIIIAALCVLLLIVIDKFALHGGLEGSIYRITAKPLIFLQSRFTQSRVAELTQERDQLLGNRVSVEEFQRENALLRKQLGLNSRQEEIFTDAHIFDVQSNKLLSTLLIDKGNIEGIKVGMTVVAAGNILAGKIGEVFDHTSRVIMVGDPHSIISARILDTKLLVESRGNGGSTVNINLVAHSDAIENGAIVVTSGLDEYPQSLAIGKITEVNNNQQNLFKSVEGELFFDPSANPVVFVIK